MSKASDPGSGREGDRRSQPPGDAAAMPARPGSRSVPFSSEDIDAQIRWFFENARERNPPRP